jgi:hypothetical protein
MDNKSKAMGEKGKLETRPWGTMMKKVTRPKRRRMEKSN